MRNIVNIINFIRVQDPRAPERDFVTPVKKQLELLDRYGFNGTFLLEYDALILPIYRDLLKHTRHEIGAWFEPVQALVERAGIPWRGREGYSWDWYSNVGILAAYTPVQRERLIDAYMQTFYELFGYYPVSVGAWVWDAHSLHYLQEKYNVQAACICKEQYGTDGYTLWGGFFCGGYYPSRNNALSPARFGEGQINLPVFRMLGSDPIYQYDYGTDTESGCDSFQPVITLEPSCDGVGGASPEWVDWFFDETFGNDVGAYSYVQVGQENAMGWESMRDGLIYQLQKLAELKEKYDLQIETLSETGRWYVNAFSKTSPAVSFCRTDYLLSGKATLWYNCSAYRVNFFFDNGTFRIRDLYAYSSEQREQYLTEPCSAKSSSYFTLPVIDGNRWSGGGVLAGLYFEGADSCEDVKYLNFSYERKENNAELRVLTDRFGTIKIACNVNGSLVVIPERNSERLRLVFRCDTSRVDVMRIEQEKCALSLIFKGFNYRISLIGGIFIYDEYTEIEISQKELKILFE